MSLQGLSLARSPATYDSETTFRSSSHGPLPLEFRMPAQYLKRAGEKLYSLTEEVSHLLAALCGIHTSQDLSLSPSGADTEVMQAWEQELRTTEHVSRSGHSSRHSHLVPWCEMEPQWCSGPKSSLAPCPEHLRCARLSHVPHKYLLIKSGNRLQSRFLRKAQRFREVE